jgi:hypothetical protein
MANATRRHFCSGRALILGTALLVLGGLLASQLAPHHAVAQDKKTDSKVDPPKKDTPAPSTGGGKTTVDVLAAGGGDQVKFINEQLEAKWTENKIEHAARCSDYEFIRRASLDIIGRTAKLSEIAKFMSWPAEYRRSKLIEELLNSDEYAANFANIFANLLMTRTGPKLHHEQMQVWLTDEFDNKYADWTKTVTSLLSATGRTNGPKDQPAVNFILAHMGEQLPSTDKINPRYETDGKFELVPVTSRITRLFLGLRTQCTQCHDHPFNDEWRQEHFWAINAYLRQVDVGATGRPTIMVKKKGMAKDQQYELIDMPNYNKINRVNYERRSGLIESTKPFFLDGTKFPAKLEGTRRQELARLVTKSPYFGKAFVNRMWGHFFGRGFTKDVDDFGDHSPISHHELLEKLAKDWSTQFNHNPRDIIRWICNSKAYGLSSVANKSNDKSEDEKFFSRMLLKAMTPEQLFESLMTATGYREGKNAEEKKKAREDWMNKLVVNFGDDEGNEGTFSGTVVQALLMMNGQEINTAIMDKKIGTVAHVVQNWSINKQRVGVIPAFKAAIMDLYKAALNREPSHVKIKHFREKVEVAESEWERLLDPSRFALKAGTAGAYLLADHNFVEGYCQDLMWALLNSNEFILNH